MKLESPGTEWASCSTV